MGVVSTDPWTVRALEIRGTAVALEVLHRPTSFISREVICVMRRGSRAGESTPARAAPAGPARPTPYRGPDCSGLPAGPR
jgi:hypothetical protein